jgi:hypothetical protein
MRSKSAAGGGARGDYGAKLSQTAGIDFLERFKVDVIAQIEKRGRILHAQGVRRQFGWSCMARTGGK